MSLTKRELDTRLIRTHEPTLLEYVIAYLQEELRRASNPSEEQRISNINDALDVGILFDDALEAYEEGAR